jgi:putative transposase
MMRWQTSPALHAHTADACVQAFYASLKSWRTRRKIDPDAKPPRRRKWFFRIEYKSSAIRHRNGVLTLSNGKHTPPVVLEWPWETPKTVVIRWQGEQYEAIGTYAEMASAVRPIGEKVAGIDLGEIHLAVAHDGETCTIANGRIFRSKRQYQNKLKAKLSHLIDTKKKGSRRRKRLIRSKRRQLTKLSHQLKDIAHKTTTRLVSTLYNAGVQTLVIGDVRDIRQGLDYGAKANQKIHQMLHGQTRFMLTYKAERLGMDTALQEESYTSQTCPSCGKRNKPRGREYRCTCGFRYHRDGVGSWNIRQKYLGCGPVIGFMARPIGQRWSSHVRCSSGLSTREAAGL